MIGAVKRRAEQVVHGRIHHHELLAVIALAINDAREQELRRGPRWRGPAPAEDAFRDPLADPAPPCAYSLAWRSKVCLGIVFILDAETAAGIDEADIVPFSPQRIRQRSHALHGLAKRSYVRDLRANVNADSGGFQIRVFGASSVKRRRVAPGHAEFVLMQAGGNVRVGFRRDIGVHPHCEMR